MIPRLLAIVGGAAVPFTFSPYDQAWLIFPLLACLIYLWQRYPEKAFSIGWLWGTGQFLVGTYWVFISAHTYSGAPIYFAVFIALLLAVYLGSYHALIGWLWIRFQARNRGVSCALLIGLWVLAEFVRQWVFSGFPWLSVGYSQIDTPLAGFAPILGVYGLSALVLVVSYCLYSIVVKRLWRPEMATLGSILVLSLVLWGHEWTEPTGETLKVAVVQANINQGEKWTQQGLNKAIDLHLNLSRGVPEADMLVWPEVALPGTFDRYRSIYTRFDRWLKSNEVVLVAGTMRATESGQFSNAMMTIGYGHDIKSPQFYDKRHLVPFGEFFPVPQFVKAYLQAVKLPYTDLYRGADSQPTLSVKGSSISASICFEDGFANEMIETAAKSELLVNVSNDSWFGGSHAAGQHLQVARMRALEMGKSLVRATPTGVGALIDSQGQIISATDRFVPQVIIEDVTLRYGITPFMRVGNWGMFWVALILAGVGLFPRRKLR
jgi:apolipoprotein N-acyltransferase